LGTELGVQDQYTSQPHRRILFYRNMYENCTTVTSNLELVHIRPTSGSEIDLSFLDNIREVYGYVLVASNYVSRISLPSLRVIRGLVQFDPHSRGEAFSLYVAGNYDPDGNMGLRVLELPSLRGGRRVISVCYMHIYMHIKTRPPKKRKNSRLKKSLSEVVHARKQNLLPNLDKILQMVGIPNIAYANLMDH